MGTLEQESPGVQFVGGGDQQIINRDTSYSKAAIGVAGQVAKGIDEFGDISAASTAKDLVTDAQSQADQARLELEESPELDGMPDNVSGDVAKQTSKIERGVRAGTINKDNARLLVANIVTKAISEQPMFQDKIRKAASNLLGFNPESEGVRQFFSSFQTAGQVKELPIVTQARQMKGDFAVNLNTLQQINTLKANNDLSLEHLASGNISAEVHFNSSREKTAVFAQTEIMTQVIALVEAGQTIDKNVWKQTVEASGISTWASFMSDLKASGQPMPDSTTLGRMKTQHFADFDQTLGFVESYDTSFLTQQNLDRLKVAQQAFAAQAFPVISFLTTTYGDRIAGQFLDMVKDANGSQQQLKQLFDITPGFGKIAETLTKNPQEFNKSFKEFMEKLPNFGVVLTEDDGEWVDLALTLSRESPPEEQDQIFELTQARGLRNKTSSEISRTPATIATKLQKQFMKSNYTLAKATLPPQIATLILDSNRGSTVGNARAVVQRNRVVLLGDRSRYGASQTDRKPTQLVHDPANAEIQKFNLYLNAIDFKGWGDTLGANTAEQEANKFVAQINASMATQAGAVVKSETPATTVITVSPAAAAAAGKKVAAMVAEEQSARFEELSAEKAVSTGAVN